MYHKYLIKFSLVDKKGDELQKGSTIMGMWFWQISYDRIVKFIIKFLSITDKTVVVNEVIKI